MHDNTLVSVIVPCYNQGQYLDECLHSVLSQTYTDWECIIVNDGSNDDTEIISKQWLDRDSRFSCLTIKNGGLSNARNKGISVCKGTFILPLDADDKVSSSYIELALNEFKKDKLLNLVYSKAEKFGAEKGVWELPIYSYENLLIDNMIFCSAMFKKVEWERVGGYDIKMIGGFEDWEFWISLLKNNGKVKRLNEVCFYYRIKENSMLKSLGEARFEELLKYISTKHIDVYTKYYGSFRKLIKQNRYLLSENKKFMSRKKYAIKSLFKVFFRIELFNPKK